MKKKDMFNTVVTSLYHNDLIKVDEIDSYVYGLEVLLLKIMHTLIFLIFGILNESLPSMLIFLFFFSCIRARIHGYHAKTRSMCFLYSIIMCYIISLGLKYNFLNQETILFLNLLTSLLICKIIPKSAFFLLFIEIFMLILPFSINCPIFLAELFSLILYYIMH